MPLGGEAGNTHSDSVSKRILPAVHMPRAHAVSVDPRTHRVYVPLENVGGPPVLRVREPSP